MDKMESLSKLLPTTHRQLQSLGIEALILFGSHATNLAGPMSDVDIGVLVSPESHRTREDHRRQYDAIYDLITERLDRPTDIDIVFLDDAPVELQMHVVRHGRVLYRANPQSIARFRERAMTRAADFAPYRRQFERATLARIR